MTEEQNAAAREQFIEELVSRLFKSKSAPLSEPNGPPFRIDCTQVQPVRIIGGRGHRRGGWGKGSD